jgi:hypothetical protein
MTDSSPHMPPEIGRALLEVKAAIAAAGRTGHDADGEREFTYSTVDDIFAATQKLLASKGLLLEMLREGKMEFHTLPPAEIGGPDRVAIEMHFLPVWNWFGTAGEPPAAISVVYANPRAVIEIVGPYEGTKTTSAFRSTATKSYLRDLLKLPTAGGERPEGAEEGEPSQARDAGPGNKSAGVKPARLTNPLLLDTEDSATKRDDLIASLRTAAASKDGDGAAKIGAVDSAFRRSQVDWAKLKPADQKAVQKAKSDLIAALSGGPSAAPVEAVA